MSQLSLHSLWDKNPEVNDHFLSGFGAEFTSNTTSRDMRGEVEKTWPTPLIHVHNVYKVLHRGYQVFQVGDCSLIPRCPTKTASTQFLILISKN